MKKICFITTIPDTIESFIIGTAKYLHETTDWDITFICDKSDKFASSLPEYIHYIPVPMKRGISISGIGAMLKMLKVFRREKFDIIQYSTPNASLYASLAGFLARIPVRLYCQWGIVYVGFNGLKRKIFKASEKLVCRLSTYIEPDSKGNLAFAQGEGLYPEAKGSVIWNGSACGVNLERFDINKKPEYARATRKELGIPEDAFVFGFMGRVTRDKGINELLTAFRELLKTKDNIYLMLVGGFDDAPKLNEELVEWSHKCNKVIYVDNTPTPQKYYAPMDVFVLPSYREGFGMGVVEAQAMGVPVIVTDIPGPVNGMVNGSTGIIVKKADAEDLQKGMQQLYDAKESLAQMGQAGYEFVLNSFEQKKLFEYIRQDRERLLGRQAK